MTTAILSAGGRSSSSINVICTSTLARGMPDQLGG
jgi:hypothetical protein